MKEKSFEEYLEQSKQILEKLQHNDLSLNDSLKLYKDGLQSLKKANDMLEGAKFEYEKISKEIYE